MIEYFMPWIELGSLLVLISFSDEILALNHISLDEKEVIQAGVIQNFEFTYEPFEIYEKMV